MPLEETLRRELEREIEQEVDAIHRRAGEQGRALLDEAERLAKQRRGQAKKSIDEECDLRIRRSLARVEMEQRNAFLRRKQEEVDKVFELVFERLDDMRESDNGSYCRLMGKVLEHCRTLIQAPALRIRLGPGLEKLGERLSEEVDVSVETDERFVGIRVEAEEGRVRCDITVPHLLQRLRREHEGELEDILFGEET